MYEVYKITNKITGDFYIGCTGSGIKVRFRDHLYLEKYNKGQFTNLASDIIKYGSYNFNIEVLESIKDRKEAYKKESEYISMLKPKYNIAYKNRDLGFNTCTICNKKLPLNKFSKNKHGSQNVGSRCKSCESKRLGYKFHGPQYCKYCNKTMTASVYSRYHGNKCAYIDKKDGYKRCRRCDRLLPLNNFYGNGNKATCKECVSISRHTIDEALNSPLAYVRALALLWRDGKKCAPKGKRIIEIRDFIMDINYPFASTNHKKFPIDFCRREFQWYLHSRPDDDRITKYASMWEQIRQPDGTFASNYGPLFFSEQGGFNDVIRTLKEDPDSRQAIIPMAYKSNIYPGNKDQLCSLGVYFDIREGLLNMTVTMRSNSIVRFGAPIDWVCYTWLQEMVACALDMPIGKYTHHAHSAHAYEEDYNLMIKILKQPDDIYIIDYPEITDVDDLLNEKYKSDFGKWLMEAPL